MKEFTRRDFLRLLGVSAAGAVVADRATQLWAVPDELVEAAMRGPGIETFRNTVCQLCPVGCGIRVRLVDGVPVHIDGIQGHPVNAGGVCPQGAAGLDFLYHPDRVRSPLLRVGPPFASTQWKEISWDEALDRIATRMRAVRMGGNPERVAFLLGRRNHTVHHLVDRFMAAYGSPNLVLCDERALDAVPYRVMLGWDEVPAADLERTACLVSFGADFTVEGPAPVRNIAAYARMRESVEKARGRFIHVGSRFSLTASCADRFVPIRPGTHGAFALGLVNVLLRDGLVDEDHVRRATHGFDGWTDARGRRHAGFRDYVLNGFPPERVAEITGASERAIREVARQLGRFRPALALVDGDGWDTPNGFWNATCVLALNAVLGSVGVPGGLRRQQLPPLAELPDPVLDATARAGLETEPPSPRALDRDPLVEFLRRFPLGEAPPFDVAIVHGCNPGFAHPFARQAQKALGNIPLVVSITDFLDEVSTAADIVLPTHSPLERWDDAWADGGVGEAVASVGRPVVEPFHDTRHVGDIVLDLARRLGGTVARSLPFESYEAVLRHRYAALARVRDGRLVGRDEPVSGDFWEALVEAGGWYRPLRGERDRVQRRGGRIPLYLDEVAVLGSRRDGTPDERQLDEWHVRQRGEAVFLPHYEEADFEAGDGGYPLVLVPFDVSCNRRGTGANSALLQEMFGYVHRIYWEPWVELNPETAAHHGIRDGDRVAVVSRDGSLRARAVINPAMEPSVVAVPFGMGHRVGSRYARGIGVNPYDILTERIDPLWGRALRAATPVRIERAETEVS